ncbi:MAG: inositol monophosphatase family protein [Myxococcota bacterium]
MDETTVVLDLARGMAREAGALQRDRYETDLRVSTKSSAVDLVTEVDQACEALLVERLERERPGDAILAEEGGGRDFAGAPWRWIIDPLDGTTNFAHGYPRFCVSLGIERQGVRHVGVVYDPLLDELYHAVQGGGAFLNGRRLQVSGERELGRSLLATGFAYDRRSADDNNLARFGAFLRSARALRRDGSAALDLCYVAAGRFDGFWELKLHAWDVAAGALIVEEAGGRTSDLEGNPLPRSGSEIVASNGHVHPAMLTVLRPD